MTEPARTKTRRPRDLAISLLVLLIPVLLGYYFLHSKDNTVTVDPTETLASAQRAGLTDLPPAKAPDGWKIVHAQFADGVLRIGYLTKEGKGVQLIESKGPISETGLTGHKGDITVVLRGDGVDLTPLAATLPVSVQP